jgi:hypothetical protein
VALLTIAFRQATWYSNDLAEVTESGLAVYRLGYGERLMMHVEALNQELLSSWTSSIIRCPGIICLRVVESLDW